MLSKNLSFFEGLRSTDDDIGKSDIDEEDNSSGCDGDYNNLRILYALHILNYIRK